MTRPYGYIFVFWGEGFDETSATIFVSELRRAGLHVKIVGLNMQRLTGSHGLSLVPDMTLEQALARAHLARVMVFPCSAKYLPQFSYDPRIVQFLQRCAGNHTLIVGETGLHKSKTLNAMLPADVTVLEYAMAEDVVALSDGIQRTIASGTQRKERDHERGQ